MMAHIPCPQCQQHAAVQRSCVACGYVYPPASIMTVLLRLLIVMPVAVVGVLTFFLVATLLMKYLVFPALAFIVRL